MHKNKLFATIVQKEVYMPSFDTLPLPKELLSNLDQIGYKTMTPIQEKSLPHILKGSDLIAQAKTGSGKTAAFGIGVLLGIDVKKKHPQALIITPTRELASQVAEELRRLARFIPNLKILTLAGGTPMRGQIESLKHGAHIIVGTPGRLRDHQSRESIDLSHIRYVVLDEADRMLDMGFLDEINKILSNVNKLHQTLLFSATFDGSIKSLCKEVTNDAIEVKVDTTHEATNIQEEFFYTTKEDRFDSLLKVLKSYKPDSCIIFANTKQLAKELCEDLISQNFSALDLQGDLDQKDRDETLLQFANKSCSILVATDVASRGLDIPDVSLVINYDTARNDETYTHRIGRTARAGKSGVAVTLSSKKTPNIKDISSLKYDKRFTIQAPMKTICILGGKKKKLRAGDILGALTKDQKLKGEDIGKINITDNLSYVAVTSSLVQKAANIIKDGKIKGKKFKSWVLY